MPGRSNHAAIVLTVAGALWAEPNPNAPLDHPYTLRNQTPFVIEAEQSRIIASGQDWSDIFPRPCVSFVDSSRVCPEQGHFRYSDSAGSRSLVFMPEAGYEYRYLGSNAHVFDFGAMGTGASGPISFRVDARLYSELNDLWDHPSYDREPIDRQDEKSSGSVAYSSYARYRADLDYDWSWGRLSAGRDAVHWGPGLFSNLVFNQNAVPFDQLTFTTRLGPVSVQSLYGDLVIGQDWDTDTSADARYLYAHRYEWMASPNVLLGVSEQLILFKKPAPFAFVPVVPLFIAKYSEKERLNNGNIAGDVSYRIPGVGIIYSEFLIDDLQSPGSLFGDYWANKWGWMAGAHAIHDMGGMQAGLIAEYARIEPWVYTHYEPNTSQSANFDQPLGNPDGPNSQSITVKAYLRNTRGAYASLMGRWLWKGIDAGSSLLDVHQDGDTKVFLGPGTRFEWEASPCLAYHFGFASLLAQADLGSTLRAVASVNAAF